MRSACRRSSGAPSQLSPWLALGVTAVLAWPACDGQSALHREDPDETPNGFGGSSVPSGGVGNFSNGGHGAGAAPVGGNGAQGGVGPAAGFGGVGSGGVGGAGISGAAGTGGFDLGGEGGGGRGMGGRFGGGEGGFAGDGVSGGGTGGFGANPLNGFTFQTPCPGPMSGSTCLLDEGCESPEPSLPGIHVTDTVVTMPGTPGVIYDVTIHFQGVVESKTYSGGRDQDGYAAILPADGFYLSGTPASTLASIYLVRVASPARDFYLNSISPPTMSSVAPPTAVDFRGVIRVEGGTTVRLVSADGDCSILRNCGVPTSTTECNPVTVANLLPGIADEISSQPYNGQFIGMVVDSVTAL